MDSCIGRKLYINWGNIIVGVEKIMNTEENRKLLNIEDIENTPPSNCKLFSINNILETKQEQKIGNPCSEYGRTSLQDYLEDNNFWATKEEMELYNRWKIRNERKENICIKKEFDFKLGDLIKDEEYTDVYNNGQIIKIFINDEECPESFWGVIFSEIDLDIYKSCLPGIQFLYMAANTTLNGHIIGGIYSAVIDKNGQTIGI